MSDALYKTNYKVRIADADAGATLKPSALFEMLQEAATEHAQILGVDYSALHPLGLGWVVSKMSVEIEKLPHWNERVYISTWASTREKIVTYREFTAADASGNPLFTARSQWALFDINTRRIARLDSIGEWARIDGKFANSSTFDKHLLRPSAESPQTPCPVRKDDIDLNSHVNNSVYISLALQPLPETFDKFTPQKIEVSFLGEVRPEDSVVSLFQRDGDKTYHSIVNEQSGRECARINILWRAAVK